MKAPGEIDLRLLFSPVASPPEETSLIYVLFFAARLCGRRPHLF